MELILRKTNRLSTIMKKIAFGLLLVLTTATVAVAADDNASPVSTTHYSAVPALTHHAVVSNSVLPARKMNYMPASTLHTSTNSDASYVGSDSADVLANSTLSVSSNGMTPNIRTPQFGANLKNRYTGHQKAPPISLNFTNIKVRELLQIIAQFTKLNFVINDTVKGEMSIHLHQVPWTQALDVILKSQNLGERQAGNIIYIAPMDELMKQQISELEAKQRMRDLAPLEDKVIRLNYADAEDIQNTLVSKNSSLLSSRGSTSIDKRTNSIWIHDTASHIRTVEALVEQLDRPVKQVMIEARIVSIDRKFERQLGARFGLSKPSQLSGTLQGANAMQVAGGSVVAVPYASRLNFNLPATGAIFGSNAVPGSIGLALAKLGSTYVDMELSALEQQNELDIISSPRLITSNQQKAYIETGKQIPYQSASSSGATAVSFANALLKLEVTPQITPDNRVILNLVVTNDSAGTPVPLTVPGGQGQGTQASGGGGSAIPINTEEVGSRVLLNNNQTVVLGGVYQRQKSDVIQRIPFLGNLPLIGHLFKNTDRSHKDAELLIFLTPHIIQKPADASSSY